MQADLASSIAQLDAQQGLVQQAQAALKESGESLNKTAIYSPMDGTVSKLNVELGERVLGSGFSQGTDLMTVADLGKMEAIVDVDENDVVLVSIGDTAKIELDAFKNKVYNGVVTQIANSAKTTAAWAPRKKWSISPSRSPSTSSTPRSGRACPATPTSRSRPRTTCWRCRSRA